MDIPTREAFRLHTTAFQKQFIGWLRLPLVQVKYVNNH